MGLIFSSVDDQLWLKANLILLQNHCNHCNALRQIQITKYKSRNKRKIQNTNDNLFLKPTKPVPPTKQCREKSFMKDNSFLPLNLLRKIKKMKQRVVNRKCRKYKCSQSSATQNRVRPLCFWIFYAAAMSSRRDGIRNHNNVS